METLRKDVRYTFYIGLCNNSQSAIESQIYSRLVRGVHTCGVGDSMDCVNDFEVF